MADVRRNVVEELGKFCLETSIHGFFHIVHSRKKIFWSVLTLVAISVCIWQCSLNVQKYFEFEVKTAIMTENFETALFPAIHFCPTYSVKRNTFSRVQLHDFILTTLFVEDENPDEKQFYENGKSCKPTPNDTVVEVQEAFKEMTNLTTRYNGKYFTNFRDILVQCKWKNVPFDCASAFLDTASATIGMGFGFNGGDLSRRILDKKAGGNMNISSYDEDKFQVTSLQPTLQLTMMINQSDHCGNDKVKGGTGISFNVFGKKRWPSALTNTYTQISPGYETHVSLQMTKNNRNTEHIGKCVKYRSLYMSPNDTVYNLQACISQCLAEMEIRLCKCLVSSWLQFADDLAKELSIPIQKLRVCETGEDVKCLKVMLKDTIGKSYEHLRRNCSCPIPCYEEYYAVQTTTSLLLKRSFNKDVLRNVSDEEFRKNYLAVNFRFASMSTEIIEESQEFTRQDMFIYLGNNIGMLLGMSFTSCFEVGYIVVRLLHVSLRDVPRRLKQFITKAAKTRKAAKTTWKVARTIWKRVAELKKRKVHPGRVNPAVIHVL